MLYPSSIMARRTRQEVGCVAVRLSLLALVAVATLALGAAPADYAVDGGFWVRAH